MPGPLSGLGGKPIIGKETPSQKFVGGILIELFEGPNIDTDADGLAMSIGPAPGSGLSQQDLLNRIAAALPIRAAKRASADPEKAREKYIQDHP